MSLPKDDLYYMNLALAQAQLAKDRGEVPVGAVITDSSGHILVQAHNLRESLNSPLAHAEVLCIEQASKIRNSWRLTDCTLYVTLEPCPMCTGALISARVGRLVYGASDPKSGYVESLHNGLSRTELNHQVPYLKGLQEEASSKLLKSFFQHLRKK